MSNKTVRTIPQQDINIRPSGADLRLVKYPELDVDGNPTGTTLRRLQATVYGITDAGSTQTIGVLNDALQLMSAAQKTGLQDLVRTLFDAAAAQEGLALVTDDAPEEGI